jgi:hypothetical protein
MVADMCCSCYRSQRRGKSSTVVGFSADFMSVVQAEFLKGLCLEEIELGKKQRKKASKNSLISTLRRWS